MDVPSSQLKTLGKFDICMRPLSLAKNPPAAAATAVGRDVKKAHKRYVKRGEG